MTRAQRSPPITPLQAKHYRNTPKHSTCPTEPGGSTSPSPTALGSQCPRRGSGWECNSSYHGKETQTPRAAEVPEVWLHTRLKHEVLAGVCFIIFRVRLCCRLQSTMGGAYCSDQLISAEFWGGAGPLLQFQHLHWTSQHSDLQVLVRCLRSQQLHLNFLKASH